MGRNKWLVFFGMSLFFLSAARNTGRKLLGTYTWQYTMIENEIMLIKQNKLESVGSNTMRFNPNFTFIDSRRPACGNDISYQKKGKYFFSTTKLILHYMGGQFNDNVGGSTQQVYVLGKVYFDIRRMNGDTIFLTKVKGDSEKKVYLTEIKHK